MARTNAHDSSRRKFLKSGSTLLLGNIILNDIMAGLPGAFFKTAGALESDFSCELFRSEDLLHLKYYFYNAHIIHGRVERRVQTDPMYIYIKLPSQHIAEELVREDLRTLTDRNKFKKMRSFLGRSSWLGFRLSAGIKSFPFAPEALLDWSGNFILVTIDDFATKSKEVIVNYQAALKNLDKEFIAQTAEDLPVRHPVIGNATAQLPITTFEVPYKMWLSPIAAPADGGQGAAGMQPSNDYARWAGEHIFIRDNGLVVHYTDKKERNARIQVVSPWENELVFRDRQNQLSAPRFKVVRYFCPEPFDTKVELLPMPIHRDELKGLTMHEEYDRDVVSRYFRLSVFGATTHLKYKNDDPLQYSIVAWEQQVKYARDNYVSVTFRAVDTFTGLKLLISIIAEREFMHGVSFLPKRYYVAYAEKEKNYTGQVARSNMPFVKIIPKVAGAFFYPEVINDVPATVTRSYAVGKYKGSAFNSNNDPVDEGMLTFDYIGVDKNGKEHAIKSKIIFIPAENYRITTPEPYTYIDEEGLVHKYSAADPTVQIPHIGSLNLSHREGNTNLGPACIPDPNDTEKYKYKLVKVFSGQEQENLRKLLEGLHVHVSKEKNRKVYGWDIMNDLTYAKIDNLKGKVLREDSTNASFHTKDMLLAAGMNDDLFKRASGDLFLDDFPVVPRFRTAYVTISQIDQMQGKSEYRLVKPFEPYREGKLDIDEENPLNKARIFFELVPFIDNFFADNYRSAGAVVNPGIRISHVSALDNSISYNETHNGLNAQVMTFAKADGIAQNIANIPELPAASVFRLLNAEILGIPIIRILEDVLPVEDIPAFNYAKQFEQSMDRIRQLAAEFKSFADKWLNEYNELKAKVAEIEGNIRTAEEELQSLSKLSARDWLDTLLEESGAKDFYLAQQKALDDLSAEYNSYKGFLDKLYAKIKMADIENAIGVVLGAPQIDNVRLLFKTVKAAAYDERKLREAVKIYCIRQIPLPGKADVVYSALTAIAGLAAGIEEEYQLYYSMVNEAFREALAFSNSYAEARAKIIASQITNAIAEIPKAIREAIDENLRKENIDKWVIPAYRLMHVYETYKHVYDELRQGNYNQLAELIGANTADIDALKKELNEKIDAIEEKLVVKLKENVTDIALIGAPNEVEMAFSELKSTLLSEIQGDQRHFFRNFQQHANALRTKAETLWNGYLAIGAKLYSEYDLQVRKIQQYREALRNPKKVLEHFIQDKLAAFAADLEKEKQRLFTLVKGTDEYRQVQSVIAEMEAFKRKLNELTRQRLDYTFSTRKFKRATLAGVIEFLPAPGATELRIDTRYEIELAITAPDKPPSVAKQSFVTDSRFVNFKLGLLQLLYVDFDRVSFITGSDVKDDFTVRIRNVEFGGCLGFFQAFQDYLKSLSDNLVFDINANGARIGYGVKIPDFPAGYFNFFNLTISGLFVLPFQSDKSMQLYFGIGNELNKFGLTVMGIFGGQGYFNIIAEPKRGIVGMEVVLEFGAIFKLDLYIAYGTAYLVGGIYIKRYYGKFELRAYILCVGRLNVLGLFSASVSFYLGLEGDSHVIKGACRVRVSHRFTPFFEISVECEMEKELHGARTDSSQGKRFYLSESSLENTGITIADSNLHKKWFYADEQLYLVTRQETGMAAAPQALLLKAGNTLETVKPSLEKVSSGNLYFYQLDLSSLQSGQYELLIEQAGKKLRRTFTVVSPEQPKCEELITDETYVSAKEYYASYYHQ